MTRSSYDHRIPPSRRTTHTTIPPSHRNPNRKASGIPRSELFITSKIPPYQQGYNEAKECIDEILSGLGTDYLDLLLIHFPGCGGEDGCHHRRLDTWRAMEHAVHDKRVRALGVSNFETEHIEALLVGEHRKLNAASTGLDFSVRPSVLQSEFHPFLYRPELMQYLAKKNIVFEAYGSMNAQGLLKDNTVTEIGKKVGKSNAQVLLRWAIQHGLVILPKSVTSHRIEENVKIDDFTLSDAHMESLNTLNQDENSYWSGIGVK